MPAASLKRSSSSASSRPLQGPTAANRSADESNQGRDGKLPAPNAGTSGDNNGDGVNTPSGSQPSSSIIVRASSAISRVIPFGDLGSTRSGQLDADPRSRLAGNSQSRRASPSIPPGPVRKMTSVPFIWNVLGLGVYLEAPTPPHEPSSSRPVIVTEVDLRALLMKVLKWFLDRQGIDTHHSCVVFVGEDDDIADNSTDFPFACPGDVVEEVAWELSPELLDSKSSADFEAYMVQAYESCAAPSRRSGFSLPVLLASVVVASGYLVYVFLCDVLDELRHI